MSKIIHKKQVVDEQKSTFNYTIISFITFMKKTSIKSMNHDFAF